MLTFHNRNRCSIMDNNSKVCPVCWQITMSKQPAPDSEDSVRGMSTTCSNNGEAPGGHGADHVADHLCWHGVPFLLKGCEELIDVGRGVHSRQDSSVKLIPNVLDWVEIGRHWGLRENVDVVVCKGLHGQSCRVRPGVVMLEDGARLGHQRQDMRLDDFIHIPMSIQRSVDLHQRTPASKADGPSHYDASTTVCWCLIHPAWGETLPGSPVHPPSSVMALEHEEGLVWKPDPVPVIPEGPRKMVGGPLQPVPTMALGKDRSYDRSSCCAPCCMKAIANSLTTNSATSGQLLDCCCSWLKAISKVADPDVPILRGSSHQRSSRAWAICCGAGGSMTTEKPAEGALAHVEVLGDFILPLPSLQTPQCNIAFCLTETWHLCSWNWHTDFYRIEPVCAWFVCLSASCNSPMCPCVCLNQ